MAGNDTEKPLSIRNVDGAYHGVVERPSRRIGEDYALSGIWMNMRQLVVVAGVGQLR